MVFAVLLAGTFLAGPRLIEDLTHRFAAKGETTQRLARVPAQTASEATAELTQTRATPAGQAPASMPPAVEQESTAGPDGAIRALSIDREKKTQGGSGQDSTTQVGLGPTPFGRPVELTLTRAESKTFDLRTLPFVAPVEREREELEDPEIVRTELARTGPPPTDSALPGITPTANAPAPLPIAVYEGLDRFSWGAGSPPDPNGDVGPNHYIQTVNSSIGVYQKSDGAQLAAFTFDTFMSQGNFGNQCDNHNFGDPVVLYDTFEDRWIISDFAFTLDGGGNVNPAISFQCFAASKTGDPVTGGWNFYSIAVTDGLNDYPKFGIWPDGLYMSANVFAYAAGASFKTARVWAFNKAQMYAGAPTANVVSFDVPGGDFAVMPSNARLQTGTPPAGRPNLFISSWLFTNALTVYKFHVDWKSTSLSTFTGPDTPLAATSWPNAAVANAPQPGTANLLDVLQIRAMMQNQYTNFGGTESLWIPHTVRRANTTGFAAPRWYQADVTGGTVAPNLVQATTWDPDGANVIHRFMPSLALDRAGNMAMGYSTSNSTTQFPSIKYAGRLAADPVNTFSQTEQTFFTATASQTTSIRWGDYSSMTLDPDGCTFWYTTEYANPANQAANSRWLTKFGSINAFPGCTPVGAGGTVSGTVTDSPGSAPRSGVTVNLGARSTTTNGSGVYTFTSIPAGTYLSMTATFPGCVTGSANNIVVTDDATTPQNFSLAPAAAAACLTDTTQSDFQSGVGTNVDVATSPGDVTLNNAPTLDQQNTAGTTTGTGFGTPAWTGQTFIAGATGPLVKAEFSVFCNGCGATPPNLTLSVRATSAGLPTGADLASVSVPGSMFGSGATVTYQATFGSPATVTSGTQYALILRPVSAPAGSGYFWIRSSPSTYANGARVLSADSGGAWTADATRDYNFKAYVQIGYPASGHLISSLKDSNPAPGHVPIWQTLSWTASTPASTTVRFQVAASNSVGGPFDFVGPDTTAATFFTTSGASLSQFNGKRYLQYKAYLTSSDSAVTPTLNDVTTCYDTLPDLTINDVSANEGIAGTTTFSFTVSLSAPAAAGGVTFDITTSPNSATAPDDYTTKTLTSQSIPAGSSSYTFDVLVNGESSVESDETFFVNVTNITGANAGDVLGQGTISNDDSVNDPPTLDPIADPSAINEDAGVQTVSLSGISSGTAGVVQSLTVTATSNNTGLIPNPTVTYTSPDATGSVSYTPLANQDGTAIITVTVNDNGHGTRRCSRRSR